MRRADRLLQIVQILRRSDGPTTARALGDELEVTPRTIYRDIAVLQASRVPIDGEAGVGYLLRPGYDLPPLMFNTPEVEAIVLGLKLVIERGDAELVSGARDAMAKVEAVVPTDIGDRIRTAKWLVPHPLETGVSFGQHLPEIRKAIREGRKLRLSYCDRRGTEMQRTVKPLGLYLYSHVTLLCTWCETREGYRAFRTERISDCELKEGFDGRNGAMLKEFLNAFGNRPMPMLQFQTAQ